MECTNIRDASREQIRQLQEKELELLCAFNDFCTEHNLPFFLIGGSFIGAMRHQGFIPWDDDVDVMLLRDDYERLHHLWQEHGDTQRYTLCRSTKEHNYHHLVSTFKDNHTTFINEHSKNEDIHHGIFIDVHVLDVKAPTKWGQFTQKLYAFVYSLFNAQRLPDNKGRLLRVLTAIILFCVPGKNLRYWLWKGAEKKMSQYPLDASQELIELVAGPQGMRRTILKEWMLKTVAVPFEGVTMPIAVGQDKWMRQAFGDYMHYPPEASQRPKHSTVYINTEKPYTDYRGVYYCVSDTKKEEKSV